MVLTTIPPGSLHPRTCEEHDQVVDRVGIWDLGDDIGGRDLFPGGGDQPTGHYQPEHGHPAVPASHHTWPLPSLCVLASAEGSNRRETLVSLKSM